MANHTLDFTVALPSIDQDHASEHEGRIARLTRWIAVDWLAELRVVLNPIAVYDAVYAYPVVRCILANEAWTAHAHETQPGQRIWRIHTPAPELWRDSSASQLVATITQLIREYRAAIDAPTLFDNDEDRDAER